MRLHAAIFQCMTEMLAGEGPRLATTRRRRTCVNQSDSGCSAQSRTRPFVLVSVNGNLFLRPAQGTSPPAHFSSIFGSAGERADLLCGGERGAGVFVAGAFAWRHWAVECCSQGGGLVQ
jgi:hypothetical protein